MGRRVPVGPAAFLRSRARGPRAGAAALVGELLRGHLALLCRVFALLFGGGCCATLFRQVPPLEGILGVSSIIDWASFGASFGVRS